MWTQRLFMDDSYTEQQLVKCPITGLYNERILEAFMQQEIRHVLDTGETFGLLYIALDQWSDVSLEQGTPAWHELLRALGYVLEQMATETDRLFRAHRDDAAPTPDEATPATA